MYKTLAYKYMQYNGIMMEIDLLSKSKRKQIADSIVNGRLILVDGLDTINYEGDKIPWNSNHYLLNDSVRSNLQGLIPIQYLCASYNDTKDEKYLKCAIQIFESWYLYLNNQEDNDKNASIWSSYTVTTRTKSLVALLLLLTENNLCPEMLYDKLTEILSKHAKWLVDDCNYFYQCNQGIMADQSLIYLAMLWKNAETSSWLSHAKERLAEQIHFAFNDEMVHVENSTHYYNIVLSILLKIANFLKSFDDDYGKQLYQTVIASSDFLYWMVKPTGEMANIGDSDIYVVSDRLDYLSNPYIDYVTSAGMKGNKPVKCCSFYRQSGYFISRSDWNQDTWNNATWFLFKSGYLSRVHKHADDLSFLLTSRGYDIFIDTGRFGYKVGNSIVDYLHSALAHNTVIVDDKSYSITNERTYLSGMYDFDQINENEYFISAYNRAYDGVSIQRSIYQFSDNLIVCDDVTSLDEHKYSQLFHMPEDFVVNRISNQEVICSIENMDWFVRIQQLMDIDDFNNYKGKHDNRPYGYYSRCINEITECNTLKFDKRSKSCRFITIITIEDNNRNSEIDMNDKLNYLEERRKSRIKSHYDIDKLVLETRSYSLFFKDENYKKAKEYLIEIWDAKWRKKIREYRLDPNKLAINLDFYVDSFIKVIVKTEHDMVFKKVVSKIKYLPDERHFELSEFNNALLNLHNVRQAMEWINPDTISYRIDYDYIWDVKINWMLYKDGIVIDSKFGLNKNKLNYTFCENGTYTMMYYISSSDNETLFYSFPEIVYLKKE